MTRPSACARNAASTATMHSSMPSSAATSARDRKSVPPRFTALLEALGDRPGEQRDHDLVVARDVVAAATAGAGRTLHDVHARPVMANHVEVGGDEGVRRTGVQVPAHGQCLEE